MPQPVIQATPDSDPVKPCHEPGREQAGKLNRHSLTISGLTAGDLGQHKDTMTDDIQKSYGHWRPERPTQVQK